MKARKILISSAVILILLLVFFVFSAFKNEPENILLSFDTEPVDGKESVEQVLEVLEKNNITATFFVVGEYAEEYSETVKRINTLGNEIACHTYSHPRMTKLNLNEKKEQIEKCNDILKNITKKNIAGFRAPYHEIDKETYDLLKDYNFSYDSSIIENYKLFFPKPSIKEIPISYFFLFPASDVINLYYLKMPAKMFFYLFKIKKADYISIDFHPHHIAKHKEELDGFIKYYKQKKAKFITYKEFSELEIW